MNAKQYLKQIEKMDVLIKNKTEQINALRERATSITAQFGGERVKTSKSVDNLERTIVLIVDLTTELERKIEECEQIKREVMSVIDQLPHANEIDLLYKRYIHLKTWHTVADEMAYSMQGIFKIHGAALQKVQKIIDERKSV